MENALLWEVTFFEFVLVTIVLAGGAAYMTGRAAAITWTPPLQLALYMVLLAGATRFIHFALFEGSLLSLYYYMVDLAVLLIIAFVGMRVTRARQMARQYGFRFDKSGPFGWRPK